MATEMPAIDEVVTALHGVVAELKGYDDTDTCDVRLQVYPGGDWAIRWGLSDYDQDHRGYWGASSVSVDDTEETLTTIATDLIEQAEEHAALDQED